MPSITSLKTTADAISRRTTDPETKRLAKVVHELAKHLDDMEAAIRRAEHQARSALAEAKRNH